MIDGLEVTEIYHKDGDSAALNGCMWGLHEIIIINKSLGGILLLANQ